MSGHAQLAEDLHSNQAQSIRQPSCVHPRYSLARGASAARAGGGGRSKFSPDGPSCISVQIANACLSLCKVGSSPSDLEPHERLPPIINLAIVSRKHQTLCHLYMTKND